MKRLLLLLAVFMCFGACGAYAQSYTFREGDNWVTRYLRGGGSIRNVTGLLRGSNRGAVYKSFVREDLPSKFDWREVTKLQPIRNQGSCGSCWAFSVTATTESAYIIQRGVNPDVFNLAEQTLVSSCSSSGSCRGGYFTAFSYVRDYGLPWESEDPYRARNSSCKAPFDETSKVLKWYYVGASGREPTTNEIKSAIMTYGPVSVTVNASFYGYESGIYNRCNRNRTNHMVNLEGWNDEGGYWIMRNSWGKSWGEDGYIRIKYTNTSGYKCNRIGERAAYVVLDDETN